MASGNYGLAALHHGNATDKGRFRPASDFHAFIGRVV